MKSLALSLTLLTGPLFGGDGNPPTVSVGVYVEFDHLLRAGTRTDLQNEVQAIMEPLGFDSQWRDTSAAGKESWADLAVVTFTGHCELGDVTYPAFIPGALGWTRVTDGRIQPYAVVDCDRVGALMQRALFSVPAKRREAVFDRAVARVMAHELYHIFTGTATHEGSGVGKAEFTATDLLSTKFEFHKAQANALRASSARSLLQLGPGLP